ncbi:hypothetical protein D1007_49419 [Hordeum vulgare]|nr:hypothetical protein D1007_49419 [Hordeum vulgare]
MERIRDAATPREPRAGKDHHEPSVATMEYRDSDPVLEVEADETLLVMELSEEFRSQKRERTIRIRKSRAAHGGRKLSLGFPLLSMPFSPQPSLKTVSRCLMVGESEAVTGTDQDNLITRVLGLKISTTSTKPWGVRNNNGMPPQMQGLTSGMHGDQGEGSVGSENHKQSKNQTNNQHKKKQEVVPKNPTPCPSLMSFSTVTWYNCGHPGHRQDKCGKLKCFFICKMVTHKVEDFDVKKKPHTFAKFVGSAAQGLGFCHLEKPHTFANFAEECGIVFEESRDITKEDLSKEFAAIYKTNWPWSNSLEDWTFLVKFPPEIDVDQVARYQCFGLTKEKTIIKIEVWLGNVTAEADLEVVWMKVKKT